MLVGTFDLDPTSKTSFFIREFNLDLCAKFGMVVFYLKDNFLTPIRSTVWQRGRTGQSGVLLKFVVVVPL